MARKGLKREEFVGNEWRRDGDGEGICSLSLYDVNGVVSCTQIPSFSDSVVFDQSMATTK